MLPSKPSLMPTNTNLRNLLLACSQYIDQGETFMEKEELLARIEDMRDRLVMTKIEQR